MTGFGFPKQSTHQKTGRVGETFFEHFVTNVLSWIYRPVHQESDFGIDGYIDILKDGNVTGKSIATQIKCGNSYISKKSNGGIKYEGKNKHLNYYLNLQIPIILIVLSDDCSKAFWVLFDIQKTFGSKSGWWIEVPKKNKLDINVKEILSRLAGESRDYSEEIQAMWCRSEIISNSSYFSFAIPKSEVISGSLETLESMIKDLTKNREIMLQKRMSVSVFFPGYDSDLRELYQIPEVRRWFLKTMMQGIPWFYFLEQVTGMGLQLLFICTCEVTYIGTKGDKYGLYATLEEKQWWLAQNFMNLNKFTEANDIPLKINKQISYGVGDWFVKTFGGEEPELNQ